MAIVRSEDPRDWAPIIERGVFQVAYRVLGQISFPCPIDVAVKAVDILVKEKDMGTWEWIIKDRMIVWKAVPVDGAVRMDIYVYGSAIRRRNTVLTRVGFWRMYLVETVLRGFSRILFGI